MESNKKVLLAFDMDKTITNDCSEFKARSVLSENGIKALKEFKCGGNKDWGAYQQKLFSLMKDEGIDLDKLKANIQTIELAEKMSDLFDFIRVNRSTYECIILSGGNSVYINWILEKYNAADIFSNIHCNKAVFGTENLIEVTNDSSDCIRCKDNLCKKQYLQTYLDRFDKVVYIGDGENDFCPASILRISDLLLMRKDYPLFKLVNKKNSLKP